MCLSYIILEYSIMEIPPNYTTEEHEGRPLSLRQGLQPASVQFTGKIDGVRHNETLAPVRYPQISLSLFTFKISGMIRDRIRDVSGWCVRINISSTANPNFIILVSV